MVARLSRVFPPEALCKGCVLRNHHKEPFESGKSWRPHKLLELVHSDVFSINMPSLVGAMYILNFIDYFSHFIWVFFLKKKKTFFEQFKELWSFAEKQRGRPIKCLRSNNGGEYV
jgi:hypothetical protein